MLPFLNLPVKIIKLFSSNISAEEVAAGVCMGMFMGFIPLNGPMAILLLILLLTFKINRLAAVLILPLFKIFYILGVSGLADVVGGVVLIDAGFLDPGWRFITHFPVLAFLDLNNTLIAGGLIISLILVVPVYMCANRGIIVLREKYFDKMKESRIVKWFMKMPLISKLTAFIGRVRSNG
ncbi:MAG: DUF2062 domain-containing protein [Candidatus Omnitrophica bacterium]|nr:DUF2062 domain-containing protein [Candidatus Omnitrophota bacterium]